MARESSPQPAFLSNSVPGAHPHPGPPPGLSTELLVPRHRDTQGPARGCRSAPPARDRRPEPVPHPTRQAGALRDSGGDSHPTEMSPGAQTKTGLGKVGPTGFCRRRVKRPLGLSARAGDALSRSQPTFPGSFGTTCCKLGREGSGGVKGSARGWSRAAAGAHLPEYLLMYPSPSPSHVWKRRRIRSSSPVLDVSLLLLPAPPLLRPLALPAAAIMRPLLLAGRTRCRWRIRAAPKRVAAAGNLPDDGACPVAAGRSGRGSPPLRVLPGLRRWAFWIVGAGTLGEREERKVFPSLGAQGGDGDARGEDTQEAPWKGVSSVTRAPDTWGRLGQKAGVLPAERFRQPVVVNSLCRNKNKRYHFCKLKAVLLVPLCKLRGVLHPIVSNET